MLRRVLLVLLLCYETIDFANPLLPGAVNFDDDQTIYAIQDERPAEQAAAPVVSPPASPVPLLTVRRAPLSRVVARSGPRSDRTLRRPLARPPEPPPASTSDDH